MAKKKFLAAKCKEGVIEAIDIDFIKSLENKKIAWSVEGWKSKLIKEEKNVVFEEMTETQVKKESERFGKYYDKRREKEKAQFEKEMEKARSESEAKENKKQTEKDLKNLEKENEEEKKNGTEAKKDNARRTRKSVSRRKGKK